MSNRAVILVSGGLDSATTLAIARGRGFECFALSFDYGQRHRCELDAARAVAGTHGVARHVVLDIDLREIGDSALTGQANVPKLRSNDEIETGIPITYVPARNTVFLSLALGWAESLEAFDIFIGANCLDYSGYPDCRPEYLKAFEQMANLATKAGVEGRSFRIQAPLLFMTKTEIIRQGSELGVDYSLTHSCYDPIDELNGRTVACGECDSCQLRRAGFAEAGLDDPIPYASQ